MSKLFWDTNLFIYLFENYGQLSQRTSALLRRIIARRDRLYTSTMTLGEVLVKPMEAGDEDLQRRYEAIMAQGAVILAFDREVARHYARIRADRTIRPPDAIQLACAAREGMDLFVTNDDRLIQKIIPGIQFLTSLERVPL